jgi:murein DD-endopeptidase MepM/ murein hydrolase activator NlpD
MRLRRCQRPLAAALCLLTGIAAAPPVRAQGDQPDAGTEVARLFAEAGQATARYEEGRTVALAQRAEVVRLETLLARQRGEVGLVHAELGRIARAQYRGGARASVPPVARLMLAKDPDAVLSARRSARQGELAVAHTLDLSRRAEGQLALAEQQAAAVWQQLTAHTTELEAIRKGIERKLQEAQQRLQREAAGNVAAGQCPGALRFPEEPAIVGSDWVTPVEGYELSAGFDRAGAHWTSRHTGQDFAVPIGTPVRSVGAGRVAAVACGGAFGIQVIVRHDDGYYSQYAHLSSVAVDQGQLVRAGEPIGLAGSTGNSTGPHLHFEVRLTPQLGSGVDPLRWLREHGVRP